VLPGVLTMDAGYWSEDKAKACSGQSIDAYIGTGRLPHWKPPPPQRGPLPKDADAKACMAASSDERRYPGNYTRRKGIVQEVNGQVKECRSLRRSLLRGLEKVDGEWHMIAAIHNLRKLFR
jgi:hypothetical protein